MAKLYLVSTPIGNLKDITLRAKEVLEQVNLIACEDTRKTGLLLQKIGLKKRPKLISYYEENEERRIPELIKDLKEGQNLALVSSAGTPTISDPGFKLVREALRHEIGVEAIPGPSAILASLTVSGLPTDKFLFLGFLPKKKNKKKKLFEELKWGLKTTVIFFESPYRLLKTLSLLKEIYGNIEIVICQELTKLHEQVRREKITESIKHFEKNKPKGELTILFNLQED